VKNMTWTDLADEETIKETSNSLTSRGIHVEFYQTKEETLNRLKVFIPQGADVMTGASETLREIGFVDFLRSGTHGWNNLKERIFSEKDSTKQLELRKQSVTADYFLGSVHAVARSGEVVVASNTGSQIPSYAFSSRNVVWVVGVQKIVNSLEEAMRRVREYCLPIEDKRMKEAGFGGSSIGKILIFEREKLSNRKVTLILVNERIGV
jgi:L-lactate utilization protein LutB